MLNTIRNSAAGAFANILLGLLVISFIVWGVGDMLRQHGGGAGLASVGGREISGPAFERTYRAELDRAKEMLGKAATPEALAALGLQRQVLDQMINAELLRRETEALGLLPDDAAVARTLRIRPEFQTKGAFDHALFEEILRHNGVRESDLVEDQRMQMGVQLLVGTLTAGVPVDDAEAATLYAAQHEQREADIIALSSPLVATPTAPAEGALEKFYKEHSALFMQPEFRTLSYVEVPKSALAGDDADKALAALSNKMQDMLAGGATLAEVAKSLSLPMHTVGPIDQEGKSPSGKKMELPAWSTFLETGFSLDEGAQSRLLHSGNDYFLIQADKVQPAQPKPYAEVKDKLAAAWTALERQKTLHKLADEVASALADAKDEKAVAAVLAKYKLETESSGPLARTSQKTESGMALPSGLVKGIFSRGIGQATSASSAGEGEFLIAIPRRRIAGANGSKEDQAMFKAKLTESLRQELLPVYIHYLRDKYPVTVNQRLLDAYAAPGQ